MTGALLVSQLKVCRRSTSSFIHKVRRLLLRTQVAHDEFLRLGHLVSCPETQRKYRAPVLQEKSLHRPGKRLRPSYGQ